MNNDIVIIIFSKNRPLQLTALLESLKAYCLDLNENDITVLYKTDNYYTDNLYFNVQKEFENIFFLKETDFKQDLLSLLDTKKYVLFLVDDCLISWKFYLSEIIASLEDLPTAVGFSLRLGTNINYCYTMNCYQKLNECISYNNGKLIFDWTKQEYDFGYPADISSSVYKTGIIKKIIENADIKNPNELESFLYIMCFSLFSNCKNLLLSYSTSIAFCTPMNRVQDQFKNKCSNDSKYSVDNLLKLYEQGIRIDINKFKGIIPNSPHMEVELL